MAFRSVHAERLPGAGADLQDHLVHDQRSREYREHH